MPDASFLRARLIERWFDPENAEPAEITDEQILQRVEDLVGEGWHIAGTETERLRKMIAAYLIEVFRAPANRDKAAIDAASRALVEEVAKRG